MKNSTKMRKGIESYIRFLICFLIIFIAFRNILELLIGTSVKLIPDISIILLFILFVIYKKGKVEIKKYDIFIIAFLAIAFVNTVAIQKIGLYPYIYEVRSIMVYYILFFVIRNFEYSKKYQLILSKLLQNVTFVLFVLGVIEKISGKKILFPGSVSESILYADNFGRVYSMFFNPNTYGAFLVISFFIVLYFEGKTTLVYSIVTCTSLLLSMSRSSIIIFIAGIILYELADKKKGIIRKTNYWRILTIILIAGIIYTGCEKVTEIVTKTTETRMGESGSDILNNTSTVLDRVKELSDSEIIAKSNSDGRVFYLKTGLKIFKEYPVLGTGFGTYGSAASMNWEPPIYEKYGLQYGFYSDNEYIKDIVETGIVGVVLLILFCISILYDYRKNFFCIFMCLIIGWLGLFYNVLEVQIVAFLFWTVLGIEAKKIG
ncbi:MAG: O-antigen ligase family protein [Schaedlerella sp.]|nr:O-antigen ligase family protein [Schaedlerella sp.]